MALSVSFPHIDLAAPRPRRYLVDAMVVGNSVIGLYALINTFRQDASTFGQMVFMLVVWFLQVTIASGRPRTMSSAEFRWDAIARLNDRDERQ